MSGVLRGQHDLSDGFIAFMLAPNMALNSTWSISRSTPARSASPVSCYSSPVMAKMTSTTPHCPNYRKKLSLR